MISRRAAGVMSLYRAGREIAGGAAAIRLLRRQDGTLRLEIADEIADGRLCRAVAEVEGDELERILREVATGATSVETRAAVTCSVLDVATIGPGAVTARLEDDHGGSATVTIRTSVGELAMEVAARRAELTLALVDLLSLAERHNRLGPGSRSE